MLLPAGRSEDASLHTALPSACAGPAVGVADRECPALLAVKASSDAAGWVLSRPCKQGTNRAQQQRTHTTSTTAIPETLAPSGEPSPQGTVQHLHHQSRYGPKDATTALPLQHHSQILAPTQASAYGTRHRCVFCTDLRANEATTGRAGAGCIAQCGLRARLFGGGTSFAVLCLALCGWSLHHILKMMYGCLARSGVNAF